MRDEDKTVILDLYFDKCKSYSFILEYFNNKYSYAEVKKIINTQIEKGVL